MALYAENRLQAGRLAEVKAIITSLKKSDREILGLMIAGKTNTTISELLSMPLRTVESRRRLMEKFKVDSLAALVQLITEERLLHPAFRTHFGL